MKYLLRLLLGVFFICLASCSSSSGNKEEGVSDVLSAAPPLKIGIYYEFPGKGDLSYNDMAAAGLQEALSRNDAFTIIEKDPIAPTGSTPEEMAMSNYNNQKAGIESLIEEGVDLVISVGFSFNAVLSELAQTYPNQNFAIIDSVVDQANVLSLVFAENEMTYLTGVAAALNTTSDKVGFIGGMPIPIIGKFSAGFIKGVKSVKPDADILMDYVGYDMNAWNDAASAKSKALAMYEKGVEVIQQAAGGSGLGVLQAAQEFSQNNAKKVWVIGVDADQYFTAPNYQSHILTSALKRVDKAVLEAVTAVATGDFRGGTTVMNLEKEGVGYATSGDYLTANIDQLEAVKESIINQSVTVPSEMTRLGFLNATSFELISSITSAQSVAAHMAVSDLNRDTPYAFELIELDSACIDPAPALAAAEMLVNPALPFQVKGIIGTTCSGNTMKVLDYINSLDTPVPVISASATSPALSNSDSYPNFWRTVQDDLAAADYLANLMVTDSITKPMLVYIDNEFGEGFMKGYQDLGGAFCSAQPLSEGWSATSIVTVADQMASAYTTNACDGIILFVYGEEVAYLMPTFVAQLGSDIPVYAIPDVFVGKEDPLKWISSIEDKSPFNNLKIPILSDNKDAAFSARCGADPACNNLVYTDTTYDAVMILGKSFNAQEGLNLAENIQALGTDYAGASGTINFKTNGDIESSGNFQNCSVAVDAQAVTTTCDDGFEHSRPVGNSSDTTGAAPAATSVMVEANNSSQAFKTTSITVSAGAEVTLTFKHVGTSMSHNFVLLLDDSKESEVRKIGTNVDNLNASDAVIIASSIITAGNETQVSFTAPATAGTYTYICTITGHQNMKGSLIVE